MRNVYRMKEYAKRYCNSWVASFLEVLQNNARVQTSINFLEKSEPDRQSRVASKQHQILSVIAKDKEDTRLFIREELATVETPEWVEKMIRDRYGNDKKEAQSLAPIYLLEHIQNRLNAFLSKKAESLTPEINALLEDYQNSSQFGDDTHLEHLSIPFNAQGIFLGAIAGFGTFGALAAWAAVVAAGSNLGAYLLIPTVVSLLSSIGISVGGAASAIAFVSSIGGPITIGIGLALLVCVSIFSFLGDSWENRFANKICDDLPPKVVPLIVLVHVPLLAQ